MDDNENDIWNPVYIDMGFAVGFGTTYRIHKIPFYKKSYKILEKEIFYMQGKFHNPRGPAIINFSTGELEYALNGKIFQSHKEFDWAVKNKILPVHKDKNLADMIDDEQLKMEYLLKFG